ncbi:MAG: hypothetical protein ACRDMV_01160 [Streptosporangiales bacterium]
MCPELECVPPEWVLLESLVLGCVSVGEDESVGGGVDSESLSDGDGELLELGDELEVVGCAEDGSVEDDSVDDDVGVREDVAATAVGAYAAVTRTKPSDAVIAAQARRTGARMAVLSYGVVQGAGAGPARGMRGRHLA